MGMAWEHCWKVLLLIRIFFRGTVFVKLLDYVGTLGKVIVKNGPEVFLYVVKSNSSGNVKVNVPTYIFDLAFLWHSQESVLHT